MCPDKQDNNGNDSDNDIVSDELPLGVKPEPYSTEPGHHAWQSGCRYYEEKRNDDDVNVIIKAGVVLELIIVEGDDHRKTTVFHYIRKRYEADHPENTLGVEFIDDESPPHRVVITYDLHNRTMKELSDEERTELINWCNKIDGELCSIFSRYLDDCGCINRPIFW